MTSLSSRYRRRLMTLLVVIGAPLVLAACTWFQGINEPLVDVPGGNPELGRQALSDYGCISCHSVPGINGADANVGPPLDDWAYRRYIAGLLPNEPDNLIAWIINPQQFEPDTAMPSLGVSEEDARDIASYLYTLYDD